MFGITDGTIILDSLFLEYELEDIATYYPIGCPDQVTDTLIFNNAAMLTPGYESISSWSKGGYDNYGEHNHFVFRFDTQQGGYRLDLSSNVLYNLGFSLDGFFGDHNTNTSYEQIPFPEDWYLDEEGIHIESGWGEDGWPNFANYLHILPYWHYADE